MKKTPLKRRYHAAEKPAKDTETLVREVESLRERQQDWATQLVGERQHSARWKLRAEAAEAKLAEERKARKAAEAVNAETVLAHRTNLLARIESLEVELNEARSQQTC